MHLSDVARIDQIDREHFQQHYFLPQIPLVVSKLAASWPALAHWTPEFFKARYGDKRVKLVDTGFVSPGKQYMNQALSLPLSQYIDKVLLEEQDLRLFLYNIKREMPELIDDVILPDLADGFSNLFVFMFFGCRNSVTQMHYDIDMSNVFHTVLHGKRTITLFPPDQSGNLYRYPFTCRSYVDVHRPDYERYPRLREAKGIRVTLYPGETLFIPAGYWHHVVYDEPGYALSLRCANPSIGGRLKGLYNVFLMQSIDRVMNCFCPREWFAWKEKRAFSL